MSEGPHASWKELRLRVLSARAAESYAIPGTEFADIYEQSFPLSEQLMLKEVQEGFRSGTRRLFVAELCNSARSRELAGFAVMCRVRGRSDVVLGEYLAISPRRRGSGVGGALFRFVVARLAEDGVDVIFEVEPELARARNLAERVKRIRFYEGLGARRIDCAPGYRMPDLARPGRTQPMTLWWATGRGTPVPCGTKLRECIRGIYADSYGLKDDDPLIERVIETLVCT